jgi:glycosyltransferase involved in cell wall biosynthesis
MKQDFLFIGSFYKQKGIDMLIDAYSELLKQRKDVPCLHIIGGGPQEHKVRQDIKNRKLDEKVILHGAIYDQSLIKVFFNKSLVCISPNQAGLSVLTSMGYGVPYLTSSDAITGGEIFNIEDKVTGLIFTGEIERLIEKLAWVIDNKNQMIEMGQRALEYYNKNRRPEHMAASIIEAIDFTLKKYGSTNLE